MSAPLLTGEIPPNHGHELVEKQQLYFGNKAEAQ